MYLLNTRNGQILGNTYLSMHISKPTLLANGHMHRHNLSCIYIAKPFWLCRDHIQSYVCIALNIDIIGPYVSRNLFVKCRNLYYNDKISGSCNANISLSLF